MNINPKVRAVQVCSLAQPFAKDFSYKTRIMTMLKTGMRSAIVSIIWDLYWWILYHSHLPPHKAAHQLWDAREETTWLSPDLLWESSGAIWFGAIWFLPVWNHSLFILRRTRNSCWVSVFRLALAERNAGYSEHPYQPARCKRETALRPP